MKAGNYQGKEMQHSGRFHEQLANGLTGMVFSLVDL